MRIASKKGDFPFEIRDVAHLLGLRIRRPMGSSGVYTDCPFCGDQRGKMNVNYEKDTFRCNYCDTSGGMLDLYAMVYSIDKKEAYREIMNALSTGALAPEYVAAKAKPMQPPVEQSAPASAREVHETLSLLFDLLPLYPAHENNLRERGLDGNQIKKLGYKSTPSPSECLSITKTLLDLGCTVAGVPGFYIRGDGQWTVKFTKRTAGMLLPVKGMDGLIRGAQIRLDVPLMDKNKYIWFSSSSERMGVTSGSPAHFVGNPYAKAVYQTEGIIKADVAHLFTGRTFVSVAGANNLGELDGIFAQLAKNGTVMIVEANDMDKYRNPAIKKGALRVGAIARKNGLQCNRLTWNPNHKGIDDWQLHLRKRAQRADKLDKMTFKDRYLEGLCDFSALPQEIERWRRLPERRCDLCNYLGLADEEYDAIANESVLEAMLLAQRKQQPYRIYQLELSEDEEVVPFAFADTAVMREKGKFDQPPASMYRLVYESRLLCPASIGKPQILSRIRSRYSDETPDDFPGRHVAPSDIIELYNNEERHYYYCNEAGFEAVKFSPMLALPMKSSK